MTAIDLVGIAGNLLLVGGPAYELFKAYRGLPHVKPAGSMVLAIVLGILLNTTYQAMLVSPIPLWSFIQNFTTIAIWLELYNISRATTG